MQRLSFRRRGKGPTLVLLHGFLGGSAIWHGQLRALATMRDVVCPDLAGFGASEALSAPDTIEDHARMVFELLDSQGFTEFDLLGHSMGGMVAQEMARLAPKRVRSLILYGTGPQGVLPGRFETIAQSRERFLRAGVSDTAAQIAATWFRQGERAKAYPLCWLLGRKVSMQAALASLTAWEGWNGCAALSKIRARTLIIWGSHDRSYDWSQPETLWRVIPGADLAVVPGAAHNVHLEKPRLFDALVADFLASQSPTSASA